MTLDDLIDYVMTESGEFIVGDLETTQIDRHRFHLIVKRSLALYGKYRPLTERMTLHVDSTVDLSMGGANTPPEWISRVVPLGTNGIDENTNLSAAQLVYGSGDFGNFNSSYSRPAPRNIPWEYNKPILSIYGSDDMFDITAHRTLELTNIVKDEATNRVTEAKVDGIGYQDELFLDLLVGYFLIALGRSRRAFTLNDLPVTMDAGELVGEGDEKIQTARELLQEQSNWSLALGE